LLKDSFFESGNSSKPSQEIAGKNKNEKSMTFL